MEQTTISRRELLAKGAIAGATGVITLATLGFADKAFAARGGAGDLKILNAALDLENQAIWAYGAAAGKLSNTGVGNTVKTLALSNQHDHMEHRDLFIKTIKSLGGTPVKARPSYDLSAYIKRGEGNLDSDANIAKLALALEVDAVLAYASAIQALKNPDLRAAGLTILPDESAHAAAIRSVFHSLDASIKPVPASSLGPKTRGEWVLKV
jgi:rubrerythrin